ncbi:hypothetical protein GCM10010498_34830 [Streptomyces cavourensis]|nr:hypothetical protein GCM10010498_34830 [Streptomyces cavourensis]
MWTGIPDGFWSCVALVTGVGRPTAFSAGFTAPAGFTGVVMTWGSSGSDMGSADGVAAAPDSAGRGSAYDYRPSPRQLRRSSPKRMMRRA